MTLFQKIKKAIEKCLDDKRRIAIFPFGDIGFQTKVVMKEIYGIEPTYIFDNYICKYNANVLPLSETDRLDLTDVVFIYTVAKENENKQLLLDMLVKQNVSYIELDYDESAEHAEDVRKRIRVGSEIYKEILAHNIENFVKNYSKDAKSIYFGKDSKLIHPGEYGRYREDATKMLLTSLLEMNTKVSDGFVITSTNKITTQCDIIGYNSVLQPFISDGIAKMFPAEEVRFICEIKSDMSKKDFSDALKKMARNKQIILNGRRGNLRKKNEMNFYDTISTYLICDKFNFKTDNINFEKIYEGIEKKYWHNAILSIQDGLMAYTLDTSAISSEKEAIVYLPCIEVEGKKQSISICVWDEINPINDEKKFQHIVEFYSVLLMQNYSVWTYAYDPIQYLGKDLPLGGGDGILRNIKYIDGCGIEERI